MRMKFTGFGEVKGRMSRFGAEFPNKLADAMVEEMKIELREVQARTPVDTGALKDSERIEGPAFRGRTVSVQIAAGGEDVPYAIYVHEDLEAHHRVGQAKFIESVLNESAPYMAERLAERLKSTLKD